MKYWIFDGSDVVGPFTPQELAARPGFASTSLICPENFSEDEDSWNPASKFPEFQFDTKDGSAEVVQQEEEDENFEKEMDTLLHEQSPLEATADTSQELPSLEIPKKPSKPGPIEEYFNTINGEDLGDILGIPDPNESSDMNLARALESQFNKTNPPTDKEISLLEDDPFDEFTEEESDELEEPEEVEKTKTLIPPPEPTKENTVQEPAEKTTAPQETEPIVLPQTMFREEGPASVPISQIDDNEDFLSLEDSSKTGTENQRNSSKHDHTSTPVYEPEEETEPVQPCELPTLVEQENPFAETSPQGETPVADLKPAEELEQASEPKSETVPEQTEESAPPTEAGSEEEEEEEEKHSSEEEESPSESASPTKEEDYPDQTAWFPFPEAEESDDSLTQETEQNQTNEKTENFSDEEDEENVSQPQENEDSHHKQTEEEESAETEEEQNDDELLQPELNQIRSQLKNTPEIERFLHTQRIKIKPSNKKIKTIFMLLLALLAVGVALYINTLFPSVPQPTASKKSTDTPPSASAPTPAGTRAALPPAPAASTTQDKVLAVVQNYQLPNGKGTIASYFDRTYKDKLDKGYTASWSAEPLHKSTYIVKYRLTKTRVEPIVYVFQVDASRGRLTGALNNIALDLVGKI
jgi:hypothetical protein